MQLTDESLLVGVAAGDAEAAAAFVRRYQSRLFGLAFTIVGERTSAEDVAQEALIRVWRHAANFDARRGSVQSWVLAIVRNLAIDVVRVRRPELVDPLEAARLAAAVLEPGDTEGVSGAERESLRDALGQLPPEQCRAVVLAVFAGCTAAEVASREAIPLGTAKSRIRLGLTKLRASLEVEE